MAYWTVGQAQRPGCLVARMAKTHCRESFRLRLLATPGSQTRALSPRCGLPGPAGRPAFGPGLARAPPPSLEGVVLLRRNGAGRDALWPASRKKGTYLR